MANAGSWTAAENASMNQKLAAGGIQGGAGGVAQVAGGQMGGGAGAGIQKAAEEMEEAISHISDSFAKPSEGLTARMKQGADAVKELSPVLGELVEGFQSIATGSDVFRASMEAADAAWRAGANAFTEAFMPTFQMLIESLSDPVRIEFMRNLGQSIREFFGPLHDMMVQMTEARQQFMAGYNAWSEWKEMGSPGWDRQWGLGGQIASFNTYNSQNPGWYQRRRDS
ncbi:MAG: hypothetical protein JW839_02135 [Candidatus Lokiarchaeota archaeon]|nr:hypothetical protein [Candidatus Lokiarchaeota archaeon]